MTVNTNAHDQDTSGGAPADAFQCAATTPGDEHARLDQFVGTWQCRGRFWMEPGADCIASDGTMVNAWTLDGRYLQQSYTADFMGSPFQGTGYWGFNKVTGKYQGLWMDTMSTWFCLDEGNYDASRQEWIMVGDWDCPQTGGKVHKRSVIRVINEDSHVMETYMPTPDGKEFLSMELTYTRQ